jgi:hypothetical protein
MDSTIINEFNKISKEEIVKFYMIVGGMKKMELKKNL